MSKIYLPNSTQLDTLNEKLGDIGETLAGQQLVTKANVVSALGYEPAEKEGTYELIETIVFEDGIQSYARSAEPDGAAYNFRAMYLYFQTPESGFSADAVADIRFILSDGVTVYNYQPGQIIKDPYGASCESCTVAPSGKCTLNGEILKTTGTIPEATTPRRTDVMVTPGSTIKSFSGHIYMNVPGEILKIYGIRA